MEKNGAANTQEVNELECNFDTFEDAVDYIVEVEGNMTMTNERKLRVLENHGLD